MDVEKQHAAWDEALQCNDRSPERLLVQRILSSQCFEKSVRMRAFLAYVCDRGLNEPEADIHEQEIGCAVFGRPPDYDTNQDNIVRVNASQLRRKLETYFSSEGSLEPLLVGLPKGQYRLRFHLRSEPAATAESPLTPSDLRSQRRKIRVLTSVAAVLALLSMALAAALVVSRSRMPADPGPATRVLWSRLIQKSQTTAVVLSDSSFGLTQDLIGKPVPLSEYIHPDIWRQAISLESKPDAQLAAKLAGRRRHTDMASVNVARRILLAAGVDQGRVSLWFARDFNLRQMKSGNVILLGSRRTNPWVEIEEHRRHFRFGFEASTRQGYFTNPQPSPGELDVYTGNPTTSYCQITLLRNSSSPGNVLIISGTDVEGTECGGEFLTSERGVTDLRKRLPADNSGQFPFFDVLLRSIRIGGTTPGCEIIATGRPESPQ